MVEKEYYENYLYGRATTFSYNTLFSDHHTLQSVHLSASLKIEDFDIFTSFCLHVSHFMKRSWFVSQFFRHEARIKIKCGEEENTCFSSFIIHNIHKHLKSHKSKFMLFYGYNFQQKIFCVTLLFFFCQACIC